jgi:glycosyltransferase involved in cell wall biosynthesis
MSSLVSLVMTVYNRERYLSQALDSILTQTYPHWQLTLWDDGSTDSSPEIARRYASLEPRIHFIAASHTGQTQALAGAMAAARSRSIFPNLDVAKASGGNYFGWIDSDDLLAPDTLATTVGILDRSPQVGMVYTNHSLIDERGKVLGLGVRCQIPYSKERLLIDFMTFHFRLIRWTIYDRVGGIDLTVPYVQDYDLCLKISEVTEIYHHPQPLYYYRVHPTMISQAQKTDVTACAAKAVRNALVRRDLSDLYRLDVIDGNKFKIVKI